MSLSLSGTGEALFIGEKEGAIFYIFALDNIMF
jgi:hypothetical protein